MKAILASVVLLAAAAVTPIRSFGQDPSTGLYTLVYLDEAGVIQSVRVTPVNRVDAVVHVEVQSVAGQRYRFIYSVENRGKVAGGDGLELLEVPCPEATVSVAAPEPWSGVRVGFRGAPSCEFASHPALRVGKAQGGLAVVGGNLPAISSLTLAAPARSVLWPSGESTPDDAYELANKVSLPQTGGVALTSLAPIRPTEELADPSVAIHTIRADLARSCGLGWVSPRGICRSLDVKLSHALVGAFLEPQALRAFLDELDAQRSKHVSPEAFALLSTNVRYLLGQTEGTHPR